LDAYEGEPWLNPEVRSLMSRIELIVDPQRDEALNGAGRLGVRVVAETSSDRHFESEVQQPKGHPDNPLDDVELIAKGGWLLEGIAEPGTAGRLWRLCHELEALANVRPLVEACCVKSAPAL